MIGLVESISPFTDRRVNALSSVPPIDSLIEISVDQPFQSEVAESWLHTVMEKALNVAMQDGPAGCQVSLLLTDDATIRELNATYRGLNEVTDVLSFSTTHPGHWEGDVDPDGLADPEQVLAQAFVLPPGELFPLGEVVVSYPQVCRQAGEFGRPTNRELALMIVHGVLHLVGYDHLEPEETAAMQAREGAALDEIFPQGTGLR